MADSWATEDRVKEISDYVAQGANEEDLLAAGFTNDELFQVGFFASPKPSNFRRPEKDDVEAKTSSLSAYTPTKRQEYTQGTQQTLTDLGLDKHDARTISEKVWGNASSTKEDLGLGLVDFTPFGIPLGAQEGKREFERGYTSDDAGTMAMGGINTGLNVLSALPGGKVVAKGLGKLSDKLVESYNPDILNMFIGPRANMTTDQATQFTRANDLEGRGLERVTRSTTGWSTDPKEGSWHYEISDENLQVPSTEINTFLKENLGEKSESMSFPEEPLFDVISHPELEKAYPFFKDYKIRFVADNYNSFDLPKEYLGSHRKYDKLITLRVGEDPKVATETLGHELQHAIDNYEGRDSGANPQQVYNDITSELDNLGEDAKSYLDLIGSVREASVKPELGLDPSSYLKKAEKVGENLSQTQKFALDRFSEITRIVNIYVDGFDGYRMYEANVGERRAKATQSRLNMTEQERRATPDPLQELDEVEAWTQRELKKVLDTLSKERNNIREDTYE